MGLENTCISTWFSIGRGIRGKAQGFSYIAPSSYPELANLGLSNSCLEPGVAGCLQMSLTGWLSQTSRCFPVVSP